MYSLILATAGKTGKLHNNKCECGVIVHRELDAVTRYEEDF